MTIVEFFGGCFNFPVSKEIIMSACWLRGVNPDDYQFYELGDNRELIIADILVMLSRASQGYQEKTGSDAFSMTISGEFIPLADRQAMRDEANAIYRKYGETDNIITRNAINI